MLLQSAAPNAALPSPVKHDTHAPPRIIFLDALRGLAALMVVIFHTATWPAWLPFVATTVDLGHAGVSLFFVISGFVIPLSLQPSRIPTFWVRRILRLFPLYWLVMCVVLGFAITQGGRLPDLSANLWEDRPALTIGANLLMLQYPLGANNLVPNAWTLIYELCFYGLMSVLVAARLRHCAAALMLLALIGLCGLAQLGMEFSNSHWNGGLVAIYLSLMLLGVVLYEAMSGMRSWRFTIGLVALVVVAHLVLEPKTYLASARVAGIGVLPWATSSGICRCRAYCWCWDASAIHCICGICW
jgi:peptidoglycan/LPS O-acetylase OafA/YrhL